MLSCIVCEASGREEDISCWSRSSTHGQGCVGPHCNRIIGASDLRYQSHQGSCASRTGTVFNKPRGKPTLATPLVLRRRARTSHPMGIARLFWTASALALVSVAAAQTTTTVEVGGSESTSTGPVQFLPASVTAPNGSVVTFRFSGAPGNHTVTQSSFSSPCEPLSGGFDSGWIYVPQGYSSGFPVWNLTITDDSKPIWYYCKQLAPVPHCNAGGMVGSINAPTSGSDTFSAFQKAAKSFSGTPGQGEGALVGQGASASIPPGPFSSGATGYSVPTGTAPPSPASTTSASPSSSAGTGAATHLTENRFVVLLLAVFGASIAHIAGYIVLGAIIFLVI